MAIGVQNPINEYMGNGSAKAFTYSFKITTAVDLKVYVNGVIQTTGFVISGAGNPSGGTLTFTVPPAHGAKVRLQRRVALERMTDYQNGSAISTDTLDNDFDRAWMAIQDSRIDTLALDLDGAFNAGGHRITNVVDPVHPQDAATKNWVETSLSAPVNIATEQAAIAVTKADEAGQSTVIALAQAGIATAKAAEAAASASSANAYKVSAENDAASANNSAIASATSAAGVLSSVTAANGYAQDAGLAASTANAARINAGISETNAAAFAGVALAHRNSASSFATTATNQAQIALDAVASMGDIEADLSLIEDAVIASQASASAASASASAASMHVTDASAYSTSSQTAATTAGGHATTATTKASEAQAAAITAGGHATAAAGSVTAAANSATQANTAFVGAQDVWEDLQQALADLESGGGGGVESVNGNAGPIVLLTKSDIGLANVDNTSDANKPVSTATQTALNLKAPINDPSFTGTVSGVTKAHVGLPNVDNTTDAAKPVSTATQTALNLKANTSSLGTLAFLSYPGGTTDYLRADGTWQTVTSGGGGGVWGSITGTLTDQTDLAATLALKAPINNPSFTGTVSGVTKAHVGLSLVDNTTDAAKPVSTATQTALNAKLNSSGTKTVLGSTTFSSLTSFTAGLNTTTFSTSGRSSFGGAAQTTPVAVSVGGTTTYNSALSNVFTSTLTTNTTIAITTPAAGHTMSIRFKQDGTGGRTVTLPSSVKAAGALETGANRVSWLTLTYSPDSTWEGGFSVVPV